MYYFNQHTFQQCWAKIWKLIKIQPVKDILMKYHLIEDPDDFHVISSPYLSPKQHADNLLSQIIPKAGDYGHYLLYMAIRDSRPSNPLGHTQAIEELKKHGKVLVTTHIGLETRRATVNCCLHHSLILQLQMLLPGTFTDCGIRCSQQDTRLLKFT